jgi:hypothetical protein
MHVHESGLLSFLLARFGAVGALTIIAALIASVFLTAFVIRKAKGR